MKYFAIAGLCLAMAAISASAQINAGDQKPEADPDGDRARTR